MLFTALVVSLQVARQKGSLSISLGGIILLLLCWLLFAIGAVYEYFYRIHGNALQDYFITVCSLSLAFVVVANERRMRHLVTGDLPIDKH